MRYACRAAQRPSTGIDGVRAALVQQPAPTALLFWNWISDTLSGISRHPAAPQRELPDEGGSGGRDKREGRCPAASLLNGQLWQRGDQAPGPRAGGGGRRRVGAGGSRQAPACSATRPAAGEVQVMLASCRKRGVLPQQPCAKSGQPQPPPPPPSRIAQDCGSLHRPCLPDLRDAFPPSTGPHPTCRPSQAAGAVAARRRQCVGARSPGRARHAAPRRGPSRQARVHPGVVDIWRRPQRSHQAARVAPPCSRAAQQLPRCASAARRVRVRCWQGACCRQRRRSRAPGHC